MKKALFRDRSSRRNVMRTIRICLFVCLGLIILLSAGCNKVEPIAAELNAMLKGSATPERTPTMIPTAPLPTRDASTPVPTVTPTRCIDTFYFVGDVTVPDYTYIAANSEFTKKWELRNNGTCVWGKGYKLRFISGDAMGGPSEVAIPRAAPGDSVTIGVDLIAPETPGLTEGYWKMFADDNLSFGTSLSVTIYVY